MFIGLGNMLDYITFGVSETFDVKLKDEDVGTSHMAGVGPSVCSKLRLVVVGLQVKG